MKRTLLTTAAIIAAGMTAHAQTQGTPPGFTVQPNVYPGFSSPPPNAYGNIDPSQSTYTTTSGLTLALDVTPHSASAPYLPTSSGPGEYGVTPGTASGRSYWDFDFGANSTGMSLSDYTFTLTVVNEANGDTASFNPALITDNNLVTTASGTNTFGNEESLDFTGPGSFFGNIAYDPNANDTYAFTLTADLGGVPVESDSILVVDGLGAPDATSTMGLMSASFVALGFMSRRFRK